VVVDGLRRWAQGSLTDQAAVELLTSYALGRHVRPGVAWVRPCVPGRAGTGLTPPPWPTSPTAAPGMRSACSSWRLG
jgi:hypothetical protein